MHTIYYIILTLLLFDTVTYTMESQQKTMLLDWLHSKINHSPTHTLNCTIGLMAANESGNTLIATDQQQKTFHYIQPESLAIKTISMTISDNHVRITACTYNHPRISFIASAYNCSTLFSMDITDNAAQPIAYRYYKSPYDIVKHNPHIATEVAFTIGDTNVERFDMRSKLSLEPLHSRKPIRHIAYDPYNENYISAGCDNGTVIIWDLRTTKQELVKRLYKKPITSLTYNPYEQSNIIIGASDRSLSNCSLTNANKEELFKNTRNITGLAFCPTHPLMIGISKHHYRIQYDYDTMFSYKSDSSNKHIFYNEDSNQFLYIRTHTKSGNTKLTLFSADFIAQTIKTYNKCENSTLSDKSIREELREQQAYESGINYHKRSFSE